MPSVSVIVAARNEIRNIDACLDSLVGLEYPHESLEILVVDDESTDGTGERIAAWAARDPRIRVLSVEGTIPGLRGKANAVAQAIERAKGEIIMTTDADCTVPPGWVRETVRRYGPGTGCVCGHTLLRTDGAFSGMQALDWAYMLTIASAGVGWGFPLSAVGNNMSYRRAAYEEVGGYRGIGFSVAEDFALFKAIGYRTGWDIRYPMSLDTAVSSEPCPDIRTIYLQKKRWGKGGVKIHPLGFAIMAIGFTTSAALLILPWIGFPMFLWIIGIAVKFGADAFLLFPTLRTFKRLHLFRYFFIFELYYLIYVVLLPFIVFLTGPVTWKERRY
ncbi:MAG: glycosyltransferase [Bacteroidota bacterium]|nr:glycosyltransferase [Bacteroidota bacterium]